MVQYPKVFFVLCSVAFLILLGSGLLTPVLPIYARNTLYASDIMVGLIVSGYYISRILVDVPGGAISDRIGRRTPIILGTFLGPIGGLICGLSLNPNIVFLGRLVWGTGVGLFFSAAYSLLFDLFPPNLRGKSMGLFQSLEQIGQFVGASMGGILADAWGMNSVFTSIVVILSIGFLFTVLPVGLKVEAKKKVEENKSDPRIKDFGFLKNWGLIIVYIGGFSRQFMNQGTIGTIFPIYLNSFGISQSLIGITMGIRILGMIIALFVSGFVMSKIGSKSILLTGFALNAAVLFFYTFVNTIESFISLAFFDGAGAGMITVSCVVLVSELVPSKVRGMGVGLYRTFFDAGAVLGPIFLTILL
jgi:MFS family permease